MRRVLATAARAALMALTTGIALGPQFRVAFAAPTVELGRKDVWKPGDLRTITIREDRLREQHVPDAEEATGPRKPLTLRTSIVEVERCLETDPDGNRTRWLVWLSSWTQDNGTTKDATLAGAWVEVSGKGKDRQYALRSAPTTPSQAALGWLARTFGPTGTDLDDVRRALLPKVAVAVGEEWTPDFGATLEAVGDKIERAKATSSARLLGNEETTSRIELAASLPLAGLPAGKDQKAIPWTKGGVYEGKGTLTLDVSGRIARSSLSTSWLLSGEAEVGGHRLTFSSKTDSVIDVKPGGTMPEPPAPSEPTPRK